jgi:predicted protein tyrosine phosphatase
MIKPWVANQDRNTVEGSDSIAPNTVCISIVSPGQPDTVISAPFEAILRLKFHDIEKLMDGYQRASKQDLEAIVAFLNQHRGKNFLIHCEAGVSRSGAIVEAILAAFPEYEDKGWDRFPNGFILMHLKRMLGVIPLGAKASD